MGTGKHRANTEVMPPFSTGLGAMSHDLFSQRATGYIPTADCRFRGTALAVLTAEAFTLWVFLGLRRRWQCFQAVPSDSRSD